MNFYIDGQNFGNRCHSEEGTCCFTCKYSTAPLESDKEFWIPCSDACFRCEDIKKKSCLDCDHKPAYMIK